MMDVAVFCFIIGFAAGFGLRPKKTDDWYEMHDLLKKERVAHAKELRYYKNLCKTMAEENAEFRRNIHSQGNIGTSQDKSSS